ncbi:hypothetical protein GCM10010492_66720 [Saccharothrix mutabilis subsp. mutabilis]|uniref:Uncharacterized protein n=1 Tax=Saccharothrix mutabilis subsp. mutabilis TaxID=66855 RepID=A0ABP3EC37_9PSEU
MGANEPHSPRSWVDLVVEFPQLKSRPYLVERQNLDSLTEVLKRHKFRLVIANPSLAGADNKEESLLKELTLKLGFSEPGAGSWAAFSDRLWDLQNDRSASPVAVIVENLDQLLHSDLHSFLRCVHNLLSMTEGVGLADPRNDLQVEYFFVGSWLSRK